MPIKGSTLLSGATVSATGGTSKTYDLTGAVIKRGVQVMDNSVSDFRLRPFINVKTKQPASKNGHFTKWNNEIVLVFPKLDTDGVTVIYPLVRIIAEPHPAQSDAEITAMLTMAAQAPVDADFSAFFKTGAIS